VRLRRRSEQPSSNLVAWAALITSIAALVMSTTGLAGAAGHSRHKSNAGAVVRLGANGRIPASELPAVGFARNAAKIGGSSKQALSTSCPLNTVNLGSFCLMKSVYVLTQAEAGENNYFFATQACERMGGYLPSAEQLIGTAPVVSLESTINDNPGTALVETDPTEAIQDQREMSSTLITTAAGSDAAGSEGVTEGSTGNPNEGQPAPTPEPADPEPETLQYVTVYDNHNRGGFAGSEPVSQPENFRCAFNKVSGAYDEVRIPGAANTGG
jgi:hypothetical protein